MNSERKQKIESMCYRQVSELKRELERSPEPFHDADYFNEVLERKSGKVTQGKNFKNRRLI